MKFLNLTSSILLDTSWCLSLKHLLICLLVSLHFAPLKASQLILRVVRIPAVLFKEDINYCINTTDYWLQAILRENEVASFPLIPEKTVSYKANILW